jgi:hypothetical protein
MMTIRNEATTGNIACAIGGVAPAINSQGSVTLAPGQQYTWFYNLNDELPNGALTCIGSAASLPLHVQYERILNYIN